MKISLPKNQDLFSVIIALLFLSIIQNVSAQDAAGKVVFAQGTPTATNTAGVQRSLARGSEIFSGDRLITDNGRLQLSMVDGAFISVQPNSEYQVETYNYTGTPDGTEQASYRLVKGGVRAVTGLIGRQNPEAYKVNTAVATIGIRGTGHNTRICAGDCGGRPDGLYHQTWEGITFVVNDVDVQPVRAGTGVYVQNIDTEIEVLDQPPGILAVETSREQVEEEEEETQEVEDQTRVVAVAEQREETGDQVIVGPSRVNSTVLTNFGLLAVAPDVDSPDGVDVSSFNFGTSIFRRSSDGAGIGILGIEDGDDVISLATIAVDAVRGGDNSSEVAVAEKLLSSASPALISEFEANPARAAESFFNNEIGFGRWTDGNVLILSEGKNSVVELVNNQSAYYIFSTEPPILPSLPVKAAYNFLDGTQSTTVSGNTIGQGITSGNILVDFVLDSALLDMNVSHNSINYAVNGPLSISTTDKFLSGFDVFATGGDCLPCDTFIDASFAGPSTGGFPKYIGLEYDIQATDVIMGVGAFQFSTFTPIETSTVLTGFGLLGVRPDTTQPDDVDVFYSEFGSSLFQRDSDSQGIGVFDTVDDGTGAEQVLATIDTEAVLYGDNAAIVSGAEALLAGADATLVAEFESNPASSAEFFSNGEIGYGRWTNGNVLAIDSIEGTEVVQLTGNQSLHYLFGTEPPALPATAGGRAKYDLLGGTQSTTVSGSTIGNGITAGMLEVNFLTSNLKLEMTVNHNSANYLVNGPLEIDPLDGSFTDIVGGVPSVFATGGLCEPSCSTFIEGGFAGPAFEGFPKYAGLEYDIQATDVIMGVATFQFGAYVTPTVDTGNILVTVYPVDPDYSEVDITLGENVSLFFDDNDHLIGGLMTNSFDSTRQAGTVDLTFMQSAGITEIDDLLAIADSAIVDSFSSLTPAMVMDSAIDANGFGWGRYTSGSFLSFGDGGTSYTNINTLETSLSENLIDGGTIYTKITNWETPLSEHFIFGQDPGVIATTGTATYDFYGGTSSTTTSSSGVGSGVTAGSIGVNFDLSRAVVNMTIDHVGAIYEVDGTLLVNTDTSVDNWLYTDSLDATTTTSGSLCNPTCGVLMDGRFAGPSNSGIPGYIAMEYDIYDNDTVMGVAGFKFANFNAPVLNTSTAITNSVIIAADPGGALPYPVNLTLGYDAAVFVDNGELVGALFSEDGDSVNSFRVVDTVDLDKVLGSDDTLAVTEVNSLLAGADSTIVDAFKAATPAMPVAAESYHDTVNDIGWGRWTGGATLLFDDTGTTGTESNMLTGNQSVYYFFGQDPGPIATSGTASYAFAGNAPSSTSVSGASIGNGVTAGTINVDFLNQIGSIDMSVDHIVGNPYTVSGDLYIATGSNNEIFGSGIAITSAAGSACNISCAAFIDGGFAGPSNAGVPGFIGIVYDINDTDPVMGIAGFDVTR